jgi:hypothetical protein
MSFVLYRLALSDPETFREALGDEVTSSGGAPVPAIRSALRHQAAIFTLGPEAEDTIAERLRIRRQLRSLMNNTPFKLSGYYVLWSVDKERDGWYMPDKGELEDGSGSIGVATGWFKMAQFVWFKIGQPRTHRRAMWVYLKDLRTGLFPRDYRKQIFSTDFSTLTALNLTYLPPGATDVSSAAIGSAVKLLALPTGFDGGACQLAVGLVDNLRVSYEQPLASRNLGQVIAYDRRGTFTAPAKEVGAGWEEMYGPDYPYNWVEGGAIDTPVLENGLCRVRYNREGTWPGWSVDVWNGTEWLEQGKIVISRAGTQDTTLVSAQLVEYSETRAVMTCVLHAGFAGSHEVVYITLERGWTGPTVEVYPALKESEEQAEAEISFFMFGTDTNISAAKIDTGNAGAAISTAMGPSHTGSFPGATALGTATFTGENEVMVLRQGKEYALSAAVVQAANKAYVRGTLEGAYEAKRNEIVVESFSAGWASMDLSFYPLQAQQILEAESMTLSSGTSNTEDATASEKHAATSTRIVDKAHVTQATWPNSDYGTYRVFAHVRVTAGEELSIYAKTTKGVGTTGATSSSTYVWLDLGDIVSNNSTLEIHAWLSKAAATPTPFYVDRIESFLVADRVTEHGGVYRGGRDLGQSVLSDSRTIPTVVTRST